MLQSLIRATSLALLLAAVFSCQGNSYAHDASKATGQAVFLQHDELVESVLSKMTLAEKIGQMTQAEVTALKIFIKNT